MTKNLIAFTGGGWNAMSGHSGWIGAALSSGKQISDQSLSLDQLFAKTESAAGNSGGSWFLSMLAYSPEFASDLSEHPDDWFSKGYFGNQKQIFAQAANSTDWTELIIDNLTNLTPKVINNIVDDVYASYDKTNPFTGLDSLLTSIGSINVVGIDAQSLANKTRDLLKSLGKEFIDDIILHFNLRPWLNEGVREAVEKFLGNNSLSESISALVTNPVQDGNGFSWYQGVKDTAFKSYNLAETLNKISQEAERLSWSAGKNILFPITVSGYPIAIGKSNDISYLEAALTPASTSSLPQEEKYLIPITAKIDPESNASSLEFPESSLTFSSFLRPEIAGLSNPVQTKSISFPLDSDLTILEMVAASGSFAGEMATSKALESLVSGLSNNLLAGIEDLKGRAAAAIESFPSKIVGDIKSEGSNFFNSLKLPTNTGDWFKDNIVNPPINFAIDKALGVFNDLVDLIPAKEFSDAVEVLSNLAFDAIRLIAEKATSLAEPAYTILADIAKDLAIPVNLSNGKVTYLNVDENIDLSTSTPLRLWH